MVCGGRNKIWIVGEDGWSRESFKAWFERVYLALLWIAVYPLVLALESRGKRRQNR